MTARMRKRKRNSSGDGFHADFVVLLRASGEDGVEVLDAGVLDDDSAFALLVFDRTLRPRRRWRGPALRGHWGLAVPRLIGFLWFFFGIEEALDVGFGLADGTWTAQ